LSAALRISGLAGIILLIFTLSGKPGEGAALPGSRSDSLFYFKGRALDSLDARPVVFTHVINTGRNTAAICDTMGYFYLRVRLNDTLKLSAIGYATLTLVIGDSMRDLKVIPDILLHEIRYSIRGVMINPLGSYSNFKYRVATLQLPPTGYEINPTVLRELERGLDTLDIIAYPAMSPVTALYNWLSREGKEKRKLARLIEEEKFEKEITYKYSPLIVSGITGYSGLQLYVFMDFCDFSMKFLRESDRYVIRDAVLEKQKLFESRRKK
jgi:hypothetical protein